MATVSTITINGVSYSVYGTETDVKNYLTGRLGTTSYDNASSTDRKKAHIQATRWIDGRKFLGTVTDLATPQPLAFPRTGIVDIEGTAIVSTVVPQEVCDATAELVLVLLATPTASDKANTGANIRKVKAGPAEVEFFTPTFSTANPFPAQVQRLLQSFIGTGTITLAESTGTSCDSSFTSDAGFSLNDGIA